MMGCSGHGELFRPPSKLSRCERVARDLVDNRPVCGIDVNRPPAPFRRLQKNSPDVRAVSARTAAQNNRTHSGFDSAEPGRRYCSSSAFGEIFGLCTAAGCVLRTASASIMRNSSFVIGGCRVVDDFHCAICCYVGTPERELNPRTTGNFVPGICTNGPACDVAGLRHHPAKPGHKKNGGALPRRFETGQSPDEFTAFPYRACPAVGRAAARRRRSGLRPAP